jgi:hypothetical protein
VCKLQLRAVLCFDINSISKHLMDFQSEIRLFKKPCYFHFDFSLCIHKGIQDSIVSIVTRLQVEQPRNDDRSKIIFASPQCSDQLRATQPPIQWVPGRHTPGIFHLEGMGLVH